jgi:rpsU-divergently transcribed protein
VERGPVELVEFFLAQKRGHVNTELQTVPSEEDVGEIQLGRLRRLVELHMEYVSSSGLLPTWPSALALLSDPRHAQTSVAAAVDLSGDLCRAAGLSPSRLDWYSERLLLVSLYSGAELFLLTDASENIEDTK